MARYQVILAYDGTAFFGMQRQANARTVQGVVEEALRKIGWTGESIHAAGRTDTGVHASGQVITFDLDWKHSPEELQSALNAALPNDVAASKVLAMGDSFHPRYDALSRTYTYRIFCQPYPNPLGERFAWRVWPEVDRNLLGESAKALLGEHDFAAFGTPPTKGGTTVRQVFTTGWLQDTEGYTFEITANAFLYHMVRRMVSIQIEVGQGRKEPEILTRYLEGKLEGMIQGLAPPHGLILTKVHYREDAGE